MSRLNVDGETRAAVEACREQLPTDLRTGRVVFGFDGFIDTVRRVVSERHGPDTYDEISSLAELADRISKSVDLGSSLSFEWLGEETRAGGHVAHLSRAYARLGFKPTMIGTFQRPPADVFSELVDDAEIVSIGEPGRTDAVEFADGKLLFLEKNDTLSIDWSTVTDRVGRRTLQEHVDGSSLLGVGYLADIPGLPSIVEGLRTEIWPQLSEPPKHVIVDPGDVRSLTADQCTVGLTAFGALGDVTEVTLSANRSEVRTLARTVSDDRDRTFSEDAAAILEHASIDRVVGHGAKESVISSPAGTARIAVPHVADPVLTTSAGDHFNVGLSLALLHGIDGGPAVALGNAVGSRFVRTGEPPTPGELHATLEQYAKEF